MRIIILLCLVLCVRCTNKTTSPLQYHGRQIIIGNGGGFTGSTSTYYLTDNGDLFKSGANDTTFVKIGKIEQKITNQYFSNYDMLQFKDVKLDEPGNRYYFVVLKDKKGQEHKIQWGKSELENKSLPIFFDNVMKSIKKINEVYKSTPNSPSKQ